MFSPQSLSYPQAEERERIARARQAAEALFRSKPLVGERAASEDPSPTVPPVRKPRVLAMLPPAPLPRAPVAVPATGPARVAHGIPRSQYARIRTWVEYGMTAAEAAEVCGTTVGEIERILGGA